MSGDLVSTIRSIRALLAEKRFTELNDRLRDMDLSKLDIIETLAYIRTPFAFRRRLPDWEAFVQRARVSFIKQGCDADVLLRGLVGTERKP